MRPPGSPTSLPPVQAQAFDGPLDLLLDEVRRQNVEIERIPMAPMVSRFLDYIRTAAEFNVNLGMDWLHMAATLIHWKSQSLLPPEAGGRAERDPIRDSLVQQLLGHRRQLGEELGRRLLYEESRIPRPVGGVVGEEASESQDVAFVCVWDMIQQARDLSRWVAKHREEQRRWQELWVDRDDVTVSEMIEYLRTQVPGGDIVDGGKLLLEQDNWSRRACLFLGMLEMVRAQELRLDQKEAFGPLWLSMAGC